MQLNPKNINQFPVELHEHCDPSLPLVSIGMPVYNAERFLDEALDSLLAQTFTDYELIISDNASTDITESICRTYERNDTRIRYVRQPYNIGMLANFQFVLHQSVGKYFMWAAADDRRSVDFLEENVFYLQSNNSLSASTSPNCYQGDEHDNSKHVRFSLTGSFAKRYLKFLSNAWSSHGIYYSLIRSKAVKSYKFPLVYQIALDWSIDLHILSQGEIFRSTNALTIIRKGGISQQGNPWKTFRKVPLELILPLFLFSKHAFSYFYRLTLRQKLSAVIKLAKLNAQAVKSNLILTLKQK